MGPDRIVADLAKCYIDEKIGKGQFIRKHILTPFSLSLYRIPLPIGDENEKNLLPALVRRRIITFGQLNIEHNMPKAEDVSFLPKHPFQSPFNGVFYFTAASGSTSHHLSLVPC